MKRIFKVNLLVRILIAIALGIGCGYFFPEWLGRLFATFNAIFSQFLGFLIPLIILGFVAPAIADIGRNAGKMLLTTAAIAYLATICSGFLSFAVGDTIFPKLITQRPLSEELPGGSDLMPFFNIEIPPLMTVMTALVLAFLLGICIASIKGGTLKSFFSEFREVVEMAIRGVIIPLLPIYIFGIFLNMTYSGQVATVLGAFAKIILVIFALHVFLLVAQYCIAALFVRKNPFKLLATMLPAYFTALGTQSSAATIPVTLRQTEKMDVSEDVAGFVVPLCATIHMSGSTMKIVCCSIALMLMQGMPYDFGMFAGFICMIGISIIAAPGVPGGAIMASLGIMASMLGFSETDQALMIALYIAMDSFGTACNVTGDGFIALIVDWIFGRKRLREAA
ncbi:MAG: dicarboxylate/amino acid:cation symporter [Muribaculaceae bacterium]|nr:dicarboxylate/amino acid:cation symporter [Muribaculaceae bacterium]